MLREKSGQGTWTEHWSLNGHAPYTSRDHPLPGYLDQSSLGFDNAWIIGSHVIVFVLSQAFLFCRVVLYFL